MKDEEAEPGSMIECVAFLFFFFFVFVAAAVVDGDGIFFNFFFLFCLCFVLFPHFFSLETSQGLLWNRCIPSAFHISFFWERTAVIQKIVSEPWCQPVLLVFSSKLWRGLIYFTCQN